MNKKEAIKTIERDKIQVGRFTEITREVNAIQRKIKIADYVPLEIVVSVINKINEVEKEKLYTVEIPNPHSYIDNHSRLARNYKGKVVLEVQDWLNASESYKLTESEIKKDFEWAWQWAKEVE